MCDVTKEEIKELKGLVNRNDQALRGSNGNPGLVTTVKLIQNDVKWIRSIMEKNNKSNITWRWIVDKLAAPAVTGIVIGVILWLVSL